jgi:hypothetical protein
MYDELNHTHHTRGAFEIELQVRAQEKRFALMRAQYRNESGLENMKKTANKIKTLIMNAIFG